ncbi:integrator complex subunit 11 [Apostasia shenzhenica]|uniref:Integrator complex subunit 11 n=1 Tax=Apostasia shenzhenica TaxID=1088818 RepID=A0A2I0AKZ8_9ASPA|nr:integrator complex subunit 11 [Apostasia shenzhenica]
MALQSQLNEVLEREEILWKQRARVDWLKHGDRNTAYFHSTANSRRKTNFIPFLKDDNGKTFNDNLGMQELIVDYFEKLFSSEVPQDMEHVTNRVQKHLTQEAIDSLQAQFNKEEITKALFQIHPTKAPGPDGFHALFYQKFWDLIGDDVSNFVMAVLNEGRSLKDVNQTNIVLIPKGLGIHHLQGLRPISLCNVIYKIIAKVLANRLKPVLSNIISDNQSAFVPKRLISDNIIVTYECFHSMTRRKKWANDFCALKLDMSKAYDRVEWPFLEKMMKVMGFPLKYI